MNGEENTQVAYWTDTSELFNSKEAFGAGEWENEPDYVWFFMEKTGFYGLILRNKEMGTLCGYLGISEGHPWYGKGIHEIGASVHGGITYAEPNFGQNAVLLQSAILKRNVFVPLIQTWNEDNILHYPEKLWVIGFDTCHMGDEIPAFLHKGYISTREYKTYKNIDYMIQNVKYLAEQALQALEN